MISVRWIVRYKTYLFLQLNVLATKQFTNMWFSSTNTALCAMRCVMFGVTMYLRADKACCYRSFMLQ